MAEPSLSWLDDFFGPAIVRIGAFFFPKRPVLEFEAGGQLNIDVEDNPLHKSTVVTISGGGGPPGGAVGAVQWHGVDGEDDVFKGAENLNVDPDTEVVTLTDGVLEGETTYTGTAIHEEDYADFRHAGETCFARSQWKKGATSGASSTVIASISLPAADIGDGTFTVHAETTYSYASGGGDLAAKAVFKRVSGTLTRVAIAPLSIAGLTWGSALGADIDMVTNGNDTVDVKAVGIAATAINYETSLHVQIATKPA